MKSFIKTFTRAEFKGDGFDVSFEAGQIEVTYEEKELHVLNDGLAAKNPIRINGVISAETVGRISLEDFEGRAGKFIMDDGVSYDVTLYSANPITFGFEKIPQ